jgi:hypothetical protein
MCLASTPPADAVETDPTPGTSGYQPWPAAPPGHDKQAAEQRNFDTYYSNPTYIASDPPAEQRNDDIDDYLVDIDDDIDDITGRADHADEGPAAEDLINLSHQLSFVIDASGQDIAPIPAGQIQNLRAADQWLQSIGLTSAGLKDPDPATQEAMHALQAAIPRGLENSYYLVYLNQGYSPEQAQTLAKQRTTNTLDSRKTRLLFNAVQVATLRIWYYYGTKFVSAAGESVSTRNNFARVTEHARQQMAIPNAGKMTARTVRNAIRGQGGYAAGRTDVNGFTYPDPGSMPIRNQCPIDYTCPPLADPT